MAKTKTPFFSMGSRGTVGGVLTSQKRGGDTILRKTPVPTDPYSLAQAYQRWDYRDYAYLWTLESGASKQSYRTRASRFHITGLSLWMRGQLKTLPGLIGRWHLDTLGGGLTPDSSKRENTGTVIGASPATGLIDRCAWFDGINDYIKISNNPFSNADVAQGAVELFFNCDQLPSVAPGLQILYDDEGYIALYFPTSNKIQARLYDGAIKSVYSINPLQADTWYHVLFQWNGTTLYLYLNNVYQGETPCGALDVDASNRPLALGSAYHGASAYFHGFIDEVRDYDRMRDATERQRLSERRYPV